MHVELVRYKKRRAGVFHVHPCAGFPPLARSGLTEDNEMKTDGGGADSLSNSCKSSAVWTPASL